MDYLPGKFIWFEHVSSDVDKARAFYGELLGWNSDAVPMGEGSYQMIMNGEDGIGGFRSIDAGQPAHWMSYVSVTDVDATAQAAAAAGAKILLPPTDFPPVGRGATLQDPQGGIFSIWKLNEGDRPDRPTPIGDWYWNELVTSDAQAALAFYTNLLGYLVDPMPMAGGGTYYVLKTGDTPRGGLMQRSAPNAPTGWLPYLRVADCDASYAEALKLGANSCVEPTDIPNVGRFAVLQDPTGAAVAIIRGEQ
jgi:hypothetical protein